MARRRRRDEELEQEENLEALQNDTAEDAYEEDAYNDDAYDDGSYDDGYDDGYDDEYDGDPYDDYEDDEEEEGAGSSYRNDIPTGFLATKKGKILVAVIAVLMLVIIGLLVASFVLSRRAADNGGGEIQDLPGATAAVATQAPNAVVFLPGSQPTAEPVQSIVQPVQPAEQQPTQAPVVVVTPQPQVITPEPTNTPAPTATPLPIILTNTPTPSPSPTPSPTPTPTPTPTPSPKPSATPRVDLAAGEANREAKLRENPSSGAKVKLTLKKGEELTIHEAVLDKDGKVWYSVSVNDRDTQGWMRDYVVDVEGEIAAPTATPAVTATPKPGSEAAADSQTPAPEQTIGIGSGKTNNDTNVRKIMNGKVLTQLRKGKAVHILDAKLDKNGNLWYEIQVKGQTTKGFVRDYLITLDKGVTIPVPTATPAVSDAPADGGEAEAELPANLLDREVVGHAQANRSANVRQEPKAGAKVVVQLKKGTDVMILGMYAEGSNIWYEVATENGETHGFARDYVLDIITLNDGLKAEGMGDGAETGADAGEAKAPVNSKYKYSGNKSSMVFHEITCDLLDSSSKNLVYMESRAYAIAKGYRPCDVCKP